MRVSLPPIYKTKILFFILLFILILGQAGLRGYQEYIDACDGVVMFWDGYGNRMIYSVDGSKPQISETPEEFFKSSLTKLYDNWYRYCLVET